MKYLSILRGSLYSRLLHTYLDFLNMQEAYYKNPEMDFGNGNLIDATLYLFGVSDSSTSPLINFSAWCKTGPFSFFVNNFFYLILARVILKTFS